MKNRFDTLVQQLKHRVLLEVAEDYWDGTLEQKRRKIPRHISPGPKSTMRCCIFKEREIVRERIELALGGDPENPNLLEVIEAACDSCPFSGIEVTDFCRGCLAHRCAQACPRNAISFGPDLRANIDKNLCVNCGLCAKGCQFGAIINRRRPCEIACKVNAIHPREDGICEIDEAKCTRCGQCSYACPFGAIMDKSLHHPGHRLPQGARGASREAPLLDRRPEHREPIRFRQGSARSFPAPRCSASPTSSKRPSGPTSWP